MILGLSGIAPIFIWDWGLVISRRKKEEGKRKKEEYRSSKLLGDLDVTFN
ncbi:hypothetical protein QUA20_27230 [Microcoleus sp. Pol7_A1]